MSNENRRLSASRHVDELINSFKFAHRETEKTKKDIEDLKLNIKKADHEIEMKRSHIQELNESLNALSSEVCSLEESLSMKKEELEIETNSKNELFTLLYDKEQEFTHITQEIITAKVYHEKALTKTLEQYMDKREQLIK